MSKALYTDKYELTMLSAALKDGTANRQSVFEVFTRDLPKNRAYGVVAGTARIVDAILNFRFDESQLHFLEQQEGIDEVVINFLRDFKFTGNVFGYPEGELFFRYSPVLQVESTFAQCVVLETLVLSILNYDSAVAGVGARMIAAANGKPVSEFGARRMNEEASISAARASMIVGFASSSNLQAGYLYDIPTSGTSAHAFTLLHDDETEAFKSQVRALGNSTTLLIDTYSITGGTERAIKAVKELQQDGVGNGTLGAVRIDSGDLNSVSRDVRFLLNSNGFSDTKIIVTNDLDEFTIDELEKSKAPIDGYGIGTRLVSGGNPIMGGKPNCAFVYKLVSRNSENDNSGEMVPVSKKSANKISLGGKKLSFRNIGQRHSLLQPLIENGVNVSGSELAGSKSWKNANIVFSNSFNLLPQAYKDLYAGDLPSLDEMIIVEEAATFGTNEMGE
jgi:nicotinate phosphoribosyltransferase